MVVAAHPRETLAPHIMEEDAEPNEELPPLPFKSCSQWLTKKLSDVLSTKHYSSDSTPSHLLLGTISVGYEGIASFFWLSPDYVPHCQSSAGQRFFPSGYGPFKLLLPPQAANFAHYCPAWYRRCTSSKNRVAWTLKFTLPTPAKKSTTHRFSAVPRGHGLSGAQTLEEAVRYARPFDYQHEATTLLSNSNFLFLPDHVLNMALSELKLWNCTSQIPLRSGCSQVPLASMTAQTLIFPTTVKLLFLLSLNATFAANSRSLNLRNSLSPGRLKMKRYWIPLPRHAVKWNALNKS